MQSILIHPLFVLFFGASVEKGPRRLHGEKLYQRTHEKGCDNSAETYDAGDVRRISACEEEKCDA